MKIKIPGSCLITIRGNGLFISLPGDRPVEINVLESSGPGVAALLLESGGYILLESGDYLLME